MKPILIAHRGDTKNFSENTLEAFNSAFEMGADGVEFDVQCQKEGKIIVVHNYTHDQEAEYPLLEQVLREFSAKGRLEIEIKALEEDCVKTIAKLIHHFQPADIEITSSELPLLPVIRKHFPKIKIGLLFKSCLIENWMPPAHIHRKLLGYMKLTGASVLHLDLKYYSLKLVELLHNKGYLTHTHLPDANRAAFEKIIQLGIDQSSYDDPIVLNFKNSPTPITR